MGFMGGIFKALGFESDVKSNAKNKKHTKASYSLKKMKSNRIDQIDGVPVYYPENTEQAKDFLSFVKEGKAVIISKESVVKEEGERMVDFLKGFEYGSKGRLVVLVDEKLFLVLPEGMEVEE